MWNGTVKEGSTRFKPFEGLMLSSLIQKYQNNQFIYLTSACQFDFHLFPSELMSFLFYPQAAENSLRHMRNAGHMTLGGQEKLCLVT